MYKIKYFSKESKKVEEIIFDTFEEAIKWGRKTLENFNADLIQTV